MTTSALIEKYAGLIHRSSALELKQNPVFMRHCRENEDFKRYVISQKPLMTSVRVPVVEFKGLKPIIVPAEAKPARIEPQAVVEEAPPQTETDRIAAKFAADYKLFKD
jgi:hypothetical protein